VVETARDSICDRHQVLVAAITGTGQHHDSPAGDIETLREIGHYGNRMCIVSVIEQHLERVFVEHIEAARRLEKGRVERSQSLAYGVQLDAERKSHRRGEHRILDIVGRAALEGRRYQVGPQQRYMAATIIESDHLTVHARLQRTGAATGADMFADQRVLGIHRDVADVLRVRMP
jgi:hypothetical protein